jgi:hypothetical protein
MRGEGAAIGYPKLMGDAQYHILRQVGMNRQPVLDSVVRMNWVSKSYLVTAFRTLFATVVI